MPAAARSRDNSKNAQIQAGPPLNSLLTSRGAMLVAALLLFGVTIVFYSTDSSGQVLAVLGFDGIVALVWMGAAAASGAVLLRWGGIKANAALLLATAAALGIGLISLVALGLGLAGWLNRTTTLLLPIPGVALALAGMVRQKQWEKWSWSALANWLRQPAGWWWVWLGPVFFLAIAAIICALAPGVAWKPDDPHPYDVLSYHLQIPREWYEAGRILPLRHNAFSYFPLNVEIQYLLAMHLCGGPWNAMYVAQFMSLVYGVLLILAVAGSAPRAMGGVVGGVMLASLPWVVMLACVAYVETAMLLYGTLSVIWCAKALPPTPWFRNTLLAGVMAGLACGAKITCVPMLLLGVPVALIGVAITANRTSRPRWFDVVRRCAVFVIDGGLVLSPWLIRTYCWTGNPVFPLAMKVLGSAHFTPQQVERFAVAHSPRPDQASLGGRFTVIWKQVAIHWQYGYLLLPLGALAALFAWRHDRSRFFLFTLAVVAVTWIGFTHLLPRFLILAAPLAALLLGEIEFSRYRPLAMVAMIVAVVSSAIALHKPVRRFCEMGRAGLFGIQDFRFIDELHDSRQKLALLGDAEAFLYQVPMDRLRYRTVFDIPPALTPPKTMGELMSDWYGSDDRSQWGDWSIVVNPAEIQRVSRTYKYIPSLPPDFTGPMDRPSILPPGKLDQ